MGLDLDPKNLFFGFWFFRDYSTGLNLVTKNQTKFFDLDLDHQKLQTVVAVVAAGAALFAVDAAGAGVVAVVVEKVRRV